MLSEENIDKKNWSVPEFSIIGFKETKGGNNPDTVEDLDIDAFDQTPS